MKKIKQVLTVKGSDVYTTELSTPIIDAIKDMAKKKVGALIVMQGNKVKGVITEQDFTRRVILCELDSQKTTVEDVMTTPVAVIDPDASINDGMAIMTEKRVRHLPVIQDNKLIGLISIGDLVKDVISEQEFMIEQLEQYIHS